MTISSMTGFARSDGETADLRWSCEARSVNNRGLDIRCRLPPRFESLETAVRTMVGERFSRGSIQLTVTLTRSRAAEPEIRLNQHVLSQILTAVKALQDAPGVQPPRLDGLLSLKGVLELEEPEETEAERARREAALLTGVALALDQLKSARRGEGQHLSEIVGQHIARIEALTAEARAEAAKLPEILRARLKDQVATLLDTGAQLDAGRLAQELALLATKADVTEEIDRLTAHVGQARKLLNTGEPVGRKLDFLTQEFNREANTLCSKSALGELTRIGLDLKSVVDQMREQVQNVE